MDKWYYKLYNNHITIITYMLNTEQNIIYHQADRKISPHTDNDVYGLTAS